MLVNTVMMGNQGFFEFKQVFIYFQLSFLWLMNCRSQSEGSGLLHRCSKIMCCSNPPQFLSFISLLSFSSLSSIFVLFVIWLLRRYHSLAQVNLHRNGSFILFVS